MNKAHKTSRLTIKLKLVMVIVIVSTVSLLLAAVLFTVFQLREYRESMVKNLTSTINITAENAQAATWFKNERDANNLLVEFASDPRILTAAIYTDDKQLFAAYDISNEDISQLFKFSRPDTKYQFENDVLHLYQPIMLSDRKTVVGFVYLKATLDSLHQQIRQNVMVTMLIVLSVLFFTFLLTSRLQKVISNPILQLLQATKRVKDEKDYSIRMTRADDAYKEIQQLCDGFNLMLDEIQRRDEELQHLALYDELTGIPNRSLFIDHFHTAIAHSQRTSTQLAICFLDLDNFKPINDNFGHEVGDKLLIEVANRIVSTIRKDDTVSRQGGDEFAVLLGDLQSVEECEQMIDRINSSVTEPYTIDNYQHKITVSSGITLYPTDSGDIDTLIRHADQAMYNAKLSGKNCFYLFNPQHDERIIQKYHQLSEIEKALATNQFKLFYQPKVNMATGELFGVEALIRWIHPEKGIIPPLEFLPIIEGSELETHIGDWVINQALMQLDEWILKGIMLEVSVNISSHHLQSDIFASKLKRALENYPLVDPNLLQLEILESSALGDIYTVCNIIVACQTLGVSIALDDFGTDYSSLTHIRRLPVQVIKIDQSFVRDILDDPSDYAIVNGVIGLADSFDRRVIAEGVESTEHGLMLLISGCHEAQGYGIAKPMPASDFTQWYLGYKPNQYWLDYASKNYSLSESKLKLLELFSAQWLSKFEKNIHRPSESQKDWPIMNTAQSHYCFWMKRIKQEHRFDIFWLAQLDSHNIRMVEMAKHLLNEYQNGDIERARDGMEALHLVAKEIGVLLQQTSTRSLVREATMD